VILEDILRYDKKFSYIVTPSVCVLELGLLDYTGLFGNNANILLGAISNYHRQPKSDVGFNLQTKTCSDYHLL